MTHERRQARKTHVNVRRDDRAAAVGRAEHRDRCSFVLIVFENSLPLIEHRSVGGNERWSAIPAARRGEKKLYCAKLNIISN